ncbi:MAG: hypothetical protein P8X55_04990 [Desulfosarcinaceae bacterium]|jgi:uncharacterized membrane protein HdeD (DUF308 family)
MQANRQTKNYVQLIWGIALLVAGIGVFFKTSQVLPMKQNPSQALCLYLLGVLLLGGGARKILRQFSNSSSTAAHTDPEVETDDADR